MQFLLSSWFRANVGFVIMVMHGDHRLQDNDNPFIGPYMVEHKISDWLQLLT